MRATTRTALAAIVAFTCVAPVRAEGESNNADPVQVAEDRYETTDIGVARPWRRPIMVDVVITGVGLGDDRRDADAEPAPCNGFRPTPADVREWLARSRRLAKHAFLEDTDWSACHATGVVRFRNGEQGQWVVRRGGAGVVTLGGLRHYVDCPRCRIERR